MLRHLFSLLLVLCSLNASAITLATWNIKRLGTNEQAQISLIASVAAKIDFIAIQEIRTLSALEELRVATEKLTHERWSVLASDPVGRGTYKEIYAFLWRESAVRYLDGAALYLDRGDRFSREPFSARFQATDTGVAFVAADVHVLYGSDRSDREAEVRRLAVYWRWLEATYPGTEPLLFGDFNLHWSDSAFGALNELASPLARRGRSTVSPRDGRFVHLYDNIWAGVGTRLPLGNGQVLDAPKLVGLSHARFREQVSDHVPIVMMMPARSKTPAQAPIIGNRASHIYHLVGCPGYSRVVDHNQVAFSTESDAKRSGYRRARNCDR